MRDKAGTTLADVMVLCAFSLIGASGGHAALVAETVGALEPAKDEALAPWTTNTHPTDVTRNHAEEITTGAHEYTVVQGGTMDGQSCRTPMGVGMNSEGAFFQTWESNRIVRMENIGETDVINPWLSNGRNDFRTVGEIVASATTPDMTDEEKALALWFQEIRYRHHSPGDNSELGDPVKVFNIYGYNTCGNDSICLGTLWREAGIQGAAARAPGHCISQAYYDGAWHLLDGDLHSLYLLRDNVTVASDVHLAQDHDLVKRTHSKGILMLDTNWDAPGVAALYFTETEIATKRSGKVDTTMGMVLRPGEALVWRWGQTSPVKYHGMLRTMPAYPHTICNGLWEYRPDLTRETWRKGAAKVEGIVSGVSGLEAEKGRVGNVVWKMKSPYVFVGGRIEATGTGARYSIRQDGKRWIPVAEGSMDRYFPIVGPAHYEFEVKCELAGDTVLKEVAILCDVQMAPRALPEMRVGENVFTYTDENTGSRNVRITHRWVERSATKPPAAPEVVYPPDGGESDGTDIVFRWKAMDPDGDGMSDYHFELSRYADMRYPLSMDFYKLSSRTMDAPRVRKGYTWKAASVKPQYTLSEPGLLAPGTTYYWHVRAMDEEGVWGPWSKTWRFTARGPGVPTELRMDFNEREAGILKWKPGVEGREPVKYRVYGSDEKGFTASDTRRQLPLGVTRKEMAAWDPWAPDTFIGETSETEMAVIGPGVDNPKANKTYYRVVAVDANGERSGPSDYAIGPRPVIYTKPVVTARVGAAYSYEVAANRSLGDYTSRSEGAGYHDIEYPRYALVKGPAWLKLDESTGVLSGIPVVAGKVEVEVRATIDRGVRKLDESKLVWGHEKVISESIELVGVSTQRFVIDVR